VGFSETGAKAVIDAEPINAIKSAMKAITSQTKKLVTEETASVEGKDTLKMTELFFAMCD